MLRVVAEFVKNKLEVRASQPPTMPSGSPPTTERHNRPCNAASAHGDGAVLAADATRAGGKRPTRPLGMCCTPSQQTIHIPTTGCLDAAASAPGQPRVSLWGVPAANCPSRPHSPGRLCDVVERHLPNHVPFYLTHAATTTPSPPTRRPARHHPASRHHPHLQILAAVKHPCASRRGASGGAAAQYCSTAGISC